jgi:hypothetical protein
MPGPAQAPKATSGLAVAAFVLGICGFIPILGVLLGLAGVVLAIIALARKVGGQGLAIAGLVCALAGIFFVNILTVAILLPTLGRARELARQAMCQANLNGIGKGVILYANDNMDRCPILPDIPGDEPARYAADLRMGARCLAEDLGTGAQQNLNLLYADNTVPLKMFLCPSTGRENRLTSANGISPRCCPSITPEKGVRDVNSRYGFGEVVGAERRSYIDYAIQIPYPRTPEGKNKCPLYPNMAAEVVIMADRGPADSFTTKWSPNHPDDGESVLYAGVTVRFSKDTNKLNGVKSRNAAGWGKNNIYTADVWTGTESDPRLKAYGTTMTTPVDDLATRDSVLYAWR